MLSERQGERSMALTLSRNALACGLEGQDAFGNPALTSALRLKIPKVSAIWVKDTGCNGGPWTICPVQSKDRDIGPNLLLVDSNLPLA